MHASKPLQSAGEMSSLRVKMPEEGSEAEEGDVEEAAEEEDEEEEEEEDEEEEEELGVLRFLRTPRSFFLSSDENISKFGKSSSMVAGSRLELGWG